MKIPSRNKTDIKKSYDALFDLVGESSTMEACNMVDKLEKDIKKYYISRGKTGNNGNFKVFLDMKYALEHYDRSDWRREEMYKLLEDLSNQISAPYSNLSLKEKIVETYDELKDDFKTLCIAGLPENMDSLTDDFIALQDLAPEMKKLGPDIYDGYDLMMRNAGKCQADLPRLMPIEKSDGRWVTNKNAIPNLTTTFQLLYSSLSQVIASLDKPEGKKEGINEKERVTDIDEEKEAVLKAEMIQLVKENWPLNEIARHENLTVDEVSDILDLNM